MRPSRTRTIRLGFTLAVGALLTLTACGDDDGAGGGGGGGGGGSTEAFCEEITAVAESDDEGSQEANLAAIQAVADAAPSEIADEMNQLVDAFEQLQSFDPQAASEEQMAEFLEIAEGVEETSEAIEEYAIENCPDLPADLFGAG
jgi:hypothetical protein